MQRWRHARAQCCTCWPAYDVRDTHTHNDWNVTVLHAPQVMVRSSTLCSYSAGRAKYKGVISYQSEIDRWEVANSRQGTSILP